MESKYLKYSFEELLEDKAFIAWVLRGKNESKWKSFIEKHPGFKRNVNQAREIILLLRDSHEILDEESILSLWQNIDRFNRLHKQKVKKLWRRKMIGRAAAILVLISLGFATYFYTTLKENSYPFTSASTQNNSQKARLVLSGGEEIDLQKDNSSIALNRDDKLIINNDSVIDLSAEKSTSNQEIKMNEVIIPYGKRSELLLSDGTHVWLNAGSRLAFPGRFTSDTRKVYLEGEACFKVAKNEYKPFIVKTGKLDISVLGTYFDVSAYPSDSTIQTVLIEGKVVVKKTSRFGLSNEKTEMHPFQKVKFDKQNNEMIMTDEPDAKVYTGWTEGWLQFSKESLFSVLNKLERYYNVEVRIPEGFSSPGMITGKLDLKDSLNQVMMALADVAQIEYRINGKVIKIEKKMKELRKK